MGQYYTKRKNSTSSFKGVTYHKHRNIYVVYVHVDGFAQYAGSCKKEEDAGRLYDVYALEWLGEDAITNAKIGLFGGTPVPPNQIDVDMEKRECIIHLTDGLKTTIDLDDLYKVKPRRWFVTYQRGKPFVADSYGYRLHRWIMDNPENYVVKHEDGNMLNNRRGNFELVEKHAEFKS